MAQPSRERSGQPRGVLWSALPTELSTAIESAHACTVYSHVTKALKQRNWVSNSA